MGNKLPLVGVEAQVQNFAGFQKAMDSINQKIANAGKVSQETAKKTLPLDKVFGSTEKTISQLTSKLSSLTSSAGPAGQAIGGVVTQLTAVSGPLGLVVAGVVALGAGFLALGNRGAPLVGLARSFDNITASVGILSSTLLQDLRKASAGTISDMGLIQTANVALSGATGKLGEELGRNLPQLLAIARQQAKVTGKDVDFLFNSIIEGIRKTSPLRLDNASLIIKVAAAEEAYAKSIGKTVEQLSTEEKGIAILNATLEAGNAALAQAGDLQETNAEKLARSEATITNTLDTLAIAVQPAFGTVLDIVNHVLDNFQQIAVGLAPILSSVASIVTDVFGHIFNVVSTIIDPIRNAILSFLPYISIVFQTISSVISTVSTTIQNVVGGIVNFLRDVSKNLFGIDIDNLGKSLFEGAARAFGAFANGIISVANALIFPAIIGVAQFIADLLIGLSPPKEGPLSKIDKGGENLMLAWLGGITGVSLDPVKQVAEQVSLALGNIGKAGLGTIEKRLAQLDKALLPFQNRLDIVKSQFEAISAPANAALDAIDRQMMAAQEALARGDVAAAETIKRLDAQRAAIQSNLDAQQKVVDNAQIQLSLAQSQQAQERALLNIRKAQLTAVQKVQAQTGEKGGVGKEPKPAAGAAAAAAEAAGIGVGLSVATGPSVLDLIGGQQAVNEAIAGIQDAFAGEIDTSQLATFQTNQGLLQGQIDRIQGVNLGDKLGEKFKGLTDLFDASVTGSPANVISNFFSPDAATSGSLANFINSIPSTIEGLTAGIQASVEGFFNSIFGTEVEGSPAKMLMDTVLTLTGDENTTGSVAFFFATMPANINTALSTLGDQVSGAFESVQTFLTGSGPGTLSGVLDDAVAFFADLPNRIVGALTGLAGSIYTSVVAPVISVINALIGAVETGLRNVVGFFGQMVNDMITQLDAANLGALVPQFIRDLGAGLAAQATSLTLGRIPETLPDFLKPPEAARGGLFSKGLLSVGERGQEYLYNASKVGVLPNSLVQAINGLQTILAQPAPLQIPGNTYNNSTNSSTYNFNGVGSDMDARRRFNSLRVSMR